MQARTGRKRLLGPHSAFYSTMYREYDPALGRFHAIDPMASSFATWTPYMYGYNDPVNANDPNGAQAVRSAFGGDYNVTNPVPIELQMLYNDPVGGSQQAWRTNRIGIGSGNHWSDRINLQAGNYNVLWQRMSGRNFAAFTGAMDVYGRVDYDRAAEVAASLEESVTLLYKWNPHGGGDATYEEWLAADGDKDKLEKGKIYQFSLGAWELVGIEQNQRPDWDLNGDGRLSKKEADLWWLFGEGEAITVDNSLIDWSGLEIEEGVEIGITFDVSTTDAFKKLPIATAATYGGTSFRRIGEKTVQVLDQLYHYDYRENENKENVIRNIMTWVGKPAEFGDRQGTDYMIHYSNPIILVE
ncbi:MAG: RHS repeat-associated core domain-containing protein [Cyclobacteriaceae bacterium]